MSRGTILTQPDLAKLPQWAIDLLAARNVRRWAQAYRKAHRRAPGIHLFEQLASRLEAPEPSQTSIRSLYDEFHTSWETSDVPERRRPLVRASSLCLYEPIERCNNSRIDINSGAGLDKKTIERDRRLYERTLWQDFHAVHATADRPAAIRSLTELGGLWPLGEPAWLTARWPTLREQQARNRRIWQEDEPPEPARAATIPHPSTRLPESLLEALSPTKWQLTYRTDSEAWNSGDPAAKRSVVAQKPKRHIRRFTLPGRHGFRKPSAAALRAHYSALNSTPALRFLSLFYREHDGALLFRARGTKPVESHIRIHGLADQSRALKHFIYWLDQRDIDNPGTCDRVLHQWGCDRESIIVFAAAGISLFFIPLKGRYTGQVIRVFILVNREEVWAKTLVDAITKFRNKLVSLVARHEMAIKMGDETKGGVTLLTLAKATPAYPG